MKPSKPRVTKGGWGSIQSISRAAAILNTLSEQPGGMTLTEVSQTVGLSTSTAHRILTSLNEEKYVQFHTSTNLWSIGVQCFIAGSAFLRSRELLTIARPFMRRLMEECGESVNLAVEDRGEVVYLAQVECRAMMRAFAMPGGRAAIHCSGVGKALLSEYDRKLVREILKQKGLAQYTPKTLKTYKAFQQSLDKSRQQGYAIDDEEQAIGVRCIAAVIHNEERSPIAAVSVTGPTVRLSDDRIEGLGSLVNRAAYDITLAYGGMP